MIQQTDELLTAIQYVMLDKLPINLINPTTLQNVLRNVSLQLPRGFWVLKQKIFTCIMK